MPLLIILIILVFVAYQLNRRNRIDKSSSLDSGYRQISRKISKSMIEAPSDKTEEQLELKELVKHEEELLRKQKNDNSILLEVVETLVQIKTNNIDIEDAEIVIVESSNNLEDMEEVPLEKEKYPVKEYYLRLFDAGGFFWDTNKYEEREFAHSWYKMRTLKDSPQNARFFPLNDQKVADILLSNTKEYLDTACEYRGEFFKGKNYKILKEGLLVHFQDKWVIAEKCQIEII